MSYLEGRGQRLMLVGLAPLLLAQGRFTRRQTSSCDPMPESSA